MSFFMGKGMLSFLAVRRKPGWLAILPHAGWMTLVHVVREAASRPEVRLLDCFALEQDLGNALQRLRTARQLKSYACTTLMASGEYTITQLDSPAVPKAERKEALRWALKESVNYPVDKACIDVLDIPTAGLPSGRSAGVLVVSASEPAVRAQVEPFESARILLDAVDVPELAQRNVAALLEDENRGLAFLRIDESGMMLTLTFHGELVAVRRGEISALQLNGDDEEQRIRARERLVLELQRSLDNFDRQYSHIPISKVVLATYPLVANLAAELSQSNYVPVKDMDLSTVLDFPAIPELKNAQCQAKNLLAIGAALRTAGAAR
jgi:MSHA biogenesis protein MshI